MNDHELINATRGIISRHSDIPPTPRDTMAVLRQAAEAQQATGSVSPAWRRWAAALAMVVIILAVGWWLRPVQPTASASVDDAFEAFWTDVNDALASVDDDAAFY